MNEEEGGGRREEGGHVEKCTQKKTPVVLNLVSGNFSITLSIFLILVGKMAKNKPSIKSNSPKAVMRSFILN